MENKFYLLNLTVSGVKSIQKDVKLEFYNKIVDKKTFDPSCFRVKGIYGENGTGKSGLIHAVKIAKAVVTRSNYLADSTTRMMLSEMINKKTREFKFICEYVDTLCGINSKSDQETFKIYHYELIIKANSAGEYIIHSEQLYVKNNRSSNKEKLVFRTENGKLVSSELCEEESVIKIKDSVDNTLLFQSFALTFLRLKDNIYYSIFEDTLSLLAFFVTAVVHVEKTDEHEPYFRRKNLNILRDNRASREEEYIQALEKEACVLNLGNNIIPKAFFKEFSVRTKKMEQFIKVFKRDLVSINIERKEDGDNYRVSLNMNYGDYSINEEFESTGIKKLISLYNCFLNASHGAVVFIDEIDANINDIYLCRLIEYFMNYGEGQLVFTTHNIDPMMVLKTSKMSIDFLTVGNKIVSWKKNANYSPEVFYRNGYIEDIPFNIDSTDFISIFEGE